MKRYGANLEFNTILIILKIIIMGIFDINTDIIPYKFYPETRDELIKCIKKIINDHKSDKIINLNCIDTSQITDMSKLFVDFQKYNFDVSQWDVGNVSDMHYMFKNCINFNCDISKWNVRYVKNMTGMFWGCKRFNCDISNWDLLFVNYMDHMFQDCTQFNKNLSKWDLSFVFCKFEIFYNCPIKDHPELQPKL